MSVAKRTYPSLEERRAWQDWLAATLAARGMSKATLARRLGTSKSMVDKYAEGADWPTDERRAEIARILGG